MTTTRTCPRVRRDRNPPRAAGLNGVRIGQTCRRFSIFLLARCAGARLRAQHHRQLGVLVLAKQLIASFHARGGVLEIRSEPKRERVGVVRKCRPVRHFAEVRDWLTLVLSVEIEGANPKVKLGRLEFPDPAGSAMV